MALRLSAGIRNFMLQNGSLKRALQNGEIKVYTGTQPATADAAATGTLLCTITKGGGVRTPEVLATGTVTLTGGASGSIDTVTVDGVNLIPHGAVPFNTSLNQTASDLADAINLGQSTPEYVAEASGAIVTITAQRGTGDTPNGFVVTATLTTITATYANMSGGVTAVNGLTLGTSAAGVLSKNATESWSGIAVATGTAGWFRYYGSVADGGGLDSAEAELRLDGACSTSGSQLNLTSLSIATGATQTVASFALTQTTS